MNLVLKDGTEFVCADNSSALEVIIFFNTMADFAEAYDKMTDENLSEFTLNESAHSNMMLYEVKHYINSGNIETHFVLETNVEAARIASLTTQLEQYKDKADAYDILVNGQTQNTEI